MIQVTMPVLGLTMEQGTIVAWLKEVGERVEEGEPLFLVETDKATSEAPAPASGFLASILVQEGETVAVGTPLAVIATTAEELGEQPSAAGAAAAPEISLSAAATAPTLADIAATGEQPSARCEQAETRAAPPRGSVRQNSSGGGRVFATPRARKRARELGLDLQAVPHEGTRIHEHHVLAVSDVRPLTRIRRLTAERMSISATTIPQVTYQARCDVTDLLDLRKGLRSQAVPRGVALPLDLFVVRAVALALADFPQINSEWVEGLGIRQHAQVNLAVAVDLEEMGLLAPVIRDAGSLGFWETAHELDRLLNAAKAKKLGPDDLAGATFTITSLAVAGVESFTPLVVPPQAAILGVGAPLVTPAYVRDRLVKRRMLMLCLTTDHRILDGTPSARFLNRVRELLEEPQRLL